MLISGDAGGSKAMPECGEASRRAPAERTATYDHERVRAIRRATRSATWSASRHAASNASSARRVPHGGRRLTEAQRSPDSGGPSPLTEDRQKPRRRQMRDVWLKPVATPRRKARNA